MVALPAAHLASGFPLSKVGRPLDDGQIYRFPLTKPPTSVNGTLTGVITNIDKPYGNVWTNISHHALADAGIKYDTQLHIVINNALTFRLPLTPTFADAGDIGAVAAYINSRGYLSLGRNAASLADRDGIQRGMSVSVTCQ